MIRTATASILEMAAACIIILPLLYMLGMVLASVAGIAPHWPYPSR